MNTKQEFLNKIRIATPCSADWDKMTGDERVRHCQQCKLDVYNIAEMNRDEAYKLIKGSSGRLCVQLYRRKDGTVITKDCPVGIERVRRAYRKCAAAIIALFAWVGFTAPAFADNKNVKVVKGARIESNKSEIGKMAGAPIPEDTILEAGRMIPTRGSVAMYPDKGEIMVANDGDLPLQVDNTVTQEKAITPLKKENDDKNRLLAGGLILMILGFAMKLIFGSMKKRSSLWIVGSCFISAFMVIGLIWQTFW